MGSGAGGALHSGQDLGLEVRRGALALTVDPHQALEPLLETVHIEAGGAAVQVSLDRLDLANRQLAIEELPK